MEYNIGTLSRLLGISVEGIRKYERSGLINSTRGVESNYRKYNYLDITSLIRTKNYRALGFSINETAYLTNDASETEVQARMKEKRAELEKETNLITQKMLLLEELESEINQICNYTGKVRIVERPGFYRFEFSKNGNLLKSRESEAVFQKWMEYVPFVKISTRYAQDGNIYGGLILGKKYADSLIDMEKVEHDIVKYYPETMCLSIIIKENKSPHANYERLDIINDYAKKHNFTLSDDIFGLNIISTHKSSDYTRFRKIYAEIIDEV